MSDSGPSMGEPMSVAPVPFPHEVVPAAPPTVRGAMPARPPKWPTVIGVIGTVIGGWGICNGVIGLCMIAFFANFEPMSKGSITSSAMFPLGIGGAVASLGAPLLVAVILLVGSIQLLRRRRGARTVLIWYSIIRIVVVAATIAYSVLATQNMLEQMSQTSAAGGASAPTLPAGTMNAMYVMMWVQIGVQAVLFLALPVFLLVWFTRAGVKRDIERHFAGGAAPA